MKSQNDKEFGTCYGKFASNRDHCIEKALYCTPTVQCDIDKGSKWSTDNLQTHLELVKYNFYLNYTAGFERYDHFMIFFQVLGAAAHDLNVKCNLLSPQDHLFLQIGDDKTETD